MRSAWVPSGRSRLTKKKLKKVGCRKEFPSSHSAQFFLQHLLRVSITHITLVKQTTWKAHIKSAFFALLFHMQHLVQSEANNKIKHIPPPWCKRVVGGESEWVNEWVSKCTRLWYRWKENSLSGKFNKSQHSSTKKDVRFNIYLVLIFIITMHNK